MVLTQPFIPKDPIRVVDFSLVNCVLDLTLPLIIVEDNPLYDESTFFNVPTHLSLEIALAATIRFVNLPEACNLIPLTVLFFIEFIIV